MGRRRHERRPIAIASMLSLPHTPQALVVVKPGPVWGGVTRGEDDVEDVGGVMPSAPVPAMYSGRDQIVGSGQHALGDEETGGELDVVALGCALSPPTTCRRPGFPVVPPPRGCRARHGMPVTRMRVTRRRVVIRPMVYASAVSARIGVQDEGDRAVVDQRHVHVGAEASGGDSGPERP